MPCRRENSACPAGETRVLGLRLPVSAVLEGKATSYTHTREDFADVVETGHHYLMIRGLYQLAFCREILVIAGDQH
jgi:hypothetical protein